MLIQDVLTRREMQVFHMLASGRTVKDVACEFGVSIKTVDSQKTSLMGKLGVNKAALLVHLAIGCGLVDPIVPERFQPECGPLVVRQGAD